jgi:hypothetical protein
MDEFMGYIRHDAVIAIIGDYSEEDKKAAKDIEKLRRKMKNDKSGIRGVPNCILGPTHGVNGYKTYLFSPDGSKEGWDTSEECDRYRAEFISIIKSTEYPAMVHLQFGGDDGETIIHDSTDQRKGW